ncbi:MAG: ABC transporter substrate-binding protein, partial [Acidimicrobiales bacterium]
MSLLAVACGARTAPYLGANGVTPGQAGLPGGTLTPGSPGSGTGTGTTPAGSTGAASGGSAAPGGSATPGGGGPATAGHAGGGTVTAAALSPSNFPFDPAAQAAACPGNGGNGASDAGVTPTTIDLGNVSGLTGVLANNFEQGSEGVQALFSAIDAAGGICGRQLKLLVEDDGQNSSKNAADVADLAPRVLAFVGSTSDADNGGVQEMINAKVPDIGQAINGNRGTSPVYWSAGGSTLYFQGGHPEIYDSLVQGLKANGNFPTKVATLAYSIPISADAAKEFQYLFTHEGATSCFTDYSISPATASLDQDVLQMKANGCQGVFTTMDVTGNAKLLQAMQRQGFHPAYAGTTFDGYTPTQISVAGASV